MTKDEALTLALEAYLCREMPAGTVIGDPKWWAPKIAAAIKEALAQPEQEPVAWMCNAFDGKVCEQSNHDECENPIPLYTTPPQRKWVALTDKQKKHAEATCMKHGLDAAIYYVQITLKEKNT